MKPIPKSLHTVTVLVAIAREISILRHPYSVEESVASAVCILGLEDAPDVYGLREQAIRKLSRNAS